MATLRLVRDLTSRLRRVGHVQVSPNQQRQFRCPPRNNIGKCFKRKGFSSVCQTLPTQQQQKSRKPRKLPWERTMRYNSPLPPSINQIEDAVKREKFRQVTEALIIDTRVRMPIKEYA